MYSNSTFTNVRIEGIYICLLCIELGSGRMTVREVKQALREYLSHPELEQLVLDKILDETLAAEQGIEDART